MEKGVDLNLIIIRIRIIFGRRKILSIKMYLLNMVEIKTEVIKGATGSPGVEVAIIDTLSKCRSNEEKEDEDDDDLNSIVFICLTNFKTHLDNDDNASTSMNDSGFVCMD